MHEASFRRGRRRHRRSIAKHTHKNTHNCWQPTQIRKSYKRHTINKAHTHTAKRPLSITIASHGQLFQTLSPVQNQQLIFSVFFFDSNFVAFFLFFFLLQILLSLLPIFLGCDFQTLFFNFVRLQFLLYISVGSPYLSFFAVAKVQLKIGWTIDGWPYEIKRRYNCVQLCCVARRAKVKHIY